MDLILLVLYFLLYYWPITLFILNFVLRMSVISKCKKDNNTELQKKNQKALIITSIVILLLSIGWGWLMRGKLQTSIDKPIIYLYPTKETKLLVKLGYKNSITVSYPKYIDGWNVLAKPNGDLIDLDTNKNLYSLYYESESNINFKIEKDGFIVKGEDVDSFLEDKLSILGLNDREKEEFIIYWLPILQKNKYNYIRFATMDEINKNMPLEFSVQPDTVIRVLMTYKGLKEPIKVEEQKLNSPTRNGFVAVEWGGTKIK